MCRWLKRGKKPGNGWKPTTVSPPGILPAQIPSRALVLTCGVDVQDDRLEATVYGWGKGAESWAILHRVFEGDPGRAELWRRLDELLIAPLQHQAAST